MTDKHKYHSQQDKTSYVGQGDNPTPHDVVARRLEDDKTADTYSWQTKPPIKIGENRLGARDKTADTYSLVNQYLNSVKGFGVDSNGFFPHNECWEDNALDNFNPERKSAGNPLIKIIKKSEKIK